MQGESQIWEAELRWQLVHDDGSKVQQLCWHVVMHDRLLDIAHCGRAKFAKAVHSTGHAAWLPEPDSEEKANVVQAWRDE